MIGDTDPEDQYDAGDPPEERLRILEKIVNSIERAEDGRELTRARDALRVLGNLESVEGVPNRDIRRLRRRLERIG